MISRLNKFIKVQKDRLPILSYSIVIYRINYAHCEASYVGQIRRLLKKSN